MEAPNFVIIGAMKAATTTLAALIGDHPEGFMTNPKEPGFFTIAEPTAAERDRYRSLFAGAGGASAVGEASTHYTKAPQIRGVPRRLYRAVPDARLIYLVRDPIDRIRSMYVHQVGNRRERRPLRDAVFADPRYLDYSRYGYQLDRFLEWFERDQMLVLRAEDLAVDPHGVLSRVASLLEIADSWPASAAEERRNTSEQWRMYPTRMVRARDVIRSTRLADRVPADVTRRFRARFQQQPIPPSMTEVPADVEAEIRALLDDDHRHLAERFSLGWPLWPSGRAGDARL